MSRKLVYFDVNGYSEPIRYMLHYGGVKFEDVRYLRRDWPNKEVKDSLPYGQLPIYEEEGRTLNQSIAIARYVAHQVDLLPSDPWEQAKLDANVLNAYDLTKKLANYFFEKDPEKKEQVKKDLEDSIVYYFSRFEKELKAGNGHFGGKLTWADFVVVGAIELLNLHLNDAKHKGYPTITALITKIHNLPGVKEYLSTNKPYVSSRYADE